MPDFEPLLQSAQHIINTYHKNESEFFAECNFLIEFAQETDDAFGFVDGKRPNYRIGIHELFDRFTEEDQRFITMTIVHELLHIIHADWNENQVASEEYRLANLAGYFDTLQRRDGAYLKRVRNFRELSQDKTSIENNSPKVTRIDQKETDDIWVKRRNEKEEAKQKEDLDKLNQKEEEEILARTGNNANNEIKRSDKCSVPECDEKVDFFSGKKCKFCHNLYCFKHIQLEKHECVKTTPVKFLRKSWLRKYGVNISSGRYIVVCDNCGYVSQLGSLIDLAGQERTQHINANGCDEKKVFLEEDLSHEKVSKDIKLESVVPSDRMFWVCSHCRPPQKFTSRSEYIAHHYAHN